MDRRSAMTLTIIASLSIGMQWPAVAQQGPLKDQLIGSWTLDSTRTTRPDGSVYGPYGPHETGTLIFERNGRFAIILINPTFRSTRPITVSSQHRKKHLPLQRAASRSLVRTL